MIPPDGGPMWFWRLMNRLSMWIERLLGRDD